MFQWKYNKWNAIKVSFRRSFWSTYPRCWKSKLYEYLLYFCGYYWIYHFLHMVFYKKILKIDWQKCCMFLIKKMTPYLVWSDNLICLPTISNRSWACSASKSWFSFILWLVSTWPWSCCNNKAWFLSWIVFQRLLLAGLRKIIFKNYLNPKNLLSSKIQLLTSNL